MATIETRIESARGCGYRKPGGIYLVGGKAFNSCGLLPVPLTVCPCCGVGIKPTRGWTWVSKQIIEGKECALKDRNVCSGCEWKNQERFGMIWIGESFYPTPASFIAESAMAGVSRRIASVPKGFKVGESWVILAHRKAIVSYNDKNEPQFTAGVFSIFRPTAIEYVVRGDEGPGRLADLEKRGFKLVKVVRDIDSQKTLESQLTTFWIKYQITEDGTDKLKIEPIQAIDQKGARKLFKIQFPAGKILSVK